MGYLDINQGLGFSREDGRNNIAIQIKGRINTNNPARDHVSLLDGCQDVLWPRVRGARDGHGHGERTASGRP